MSTKVTVNLTDKDFLMACKLFDIDPGEAVKAFIDNVSLTNYWIRDFSGAGDGLCPAATNFFLQYTEFAKHKSLPRKLVRNMWTKYTRVMADIRIRISDVGQQETKAKVLVYKWMEELCKEKKKVGLPLQ